MDKWWKTLDKAGDERGTRGDKRDLCQDCLRLFHTAGIMKGRNRWGALLEMLVSDGAGDGVREGSHPLALSRGCSGGDLDFQRGRFDCSGGEFGFRRNGRGALRSPTSPRGTGSERAATLSRSPGDVLAGIWVFDGAGAGVLVKNLASDEAGVGRSAPLHPLGGRGARGCDPLALSRGAVLAGIWVFTKRWFFF